MGSIYTLNGSGVLAEPARDLTATSRFRGAVCPVITPPTSFSVQGTTLPIATPDQDAATATGGFKRLVMYPPGSTRTDHGG